MTQRYFIGTPAERAAFTLYGPTGRPDWRAPRQGPADCWFVAAAVALAHRRPGDLVRLITANADGTFTVRFPAPIWVGRWRLFRDGRPVTVAAPAPEEGYSACADGSVWMPVLERAYAELLQRHPHWGRGPARQQIHGVRTLATGIGALTGHRTDGDWVWPNWLTRRSTTRAKLRDALANDRVVTAATRYFAGRRKRDELTRAGLAWRHVYAVLDYDAAGDRLQLRNPWGESGENGVSWVSMDEFYRMFVEIGYEQPA